MGDQPRSQDFFPFLNKKGKKSWERGWSFESFEKQSVFSCMPQLKYTVAKVMPLLNLPLLEKRAIIFWTNFLTYLQLSSCPVRVLYPVRSPSVRQSASPPVGSPHPHSWKQFLFFVYRAENVASISRYSAKHEKKSIVLS